MQKQLKIKKPAPNPYGKENVVLVGGPFDGQRVEVNAGTLEATYQSPRQGLVKYLRISIEDNSGHAALFYKYSLMSDVAAVNQLILKYR
jgi:hypothetical protein